MLVHTTAATSLTHRLAVLPIGATCLQEGHAVGRLNFAEAPLLEELRVSPKS